MIYYAIKVILSAMIIVTITETAKRNEWVGAIVASLPLTTLLAFVWLYWETGDSARISTLSVDVFWLVIPSLVLFLALPLFLRFGWGFWLSLVAAMMATAAAYGLLFWVVRRVGLEL